MPTPVKKWPTPGQQLPELNQAQWAAAVKATAGPLSGWAKPPAAGLSPGASRGRMPHRPG